MAADFFVSWRLVFLEMKADFLRLRFAVDGTR